MGWLILAPARSPSALALCGGSRGCDGARCSSSPRRCCSALAGYAWQGRPGLAGSAEARRREQPKLPDNVPLTDARTPSSAASTPPRAGCSMSEALARDGNTRGRGRHPAERGPRAIRATPQLWIGLGNALVDHARRR